MKEMKEASGGKRNLALQALGGAIWCVLAVMGLIGLYHRLRTGHDMAGYGSYVPWGIWVAFYFHGVGMATGVFLVGGMGYLRGTEGARTNESLRTAIVLSLAAMFPGLLAIGLDLGRMERGANIFLSPNFGSVMTLNAWMYNIFLLAAAVAWLLSWRKRSAWLRPLILFAALVCCAFGMGSGMFFAAVKVKPYWHNGIWPIVTLVSGLAAGAALLLFVRCAGSRAASETAEEDGTRLARRVLQGALAAYLALSGVRWMVAHIYDSGAAAIGHDAPDSTGWLYPLFGIVVPLLLLAGKRRPGWLVAALLASVGLLHGRLELVLGGQLPTEMPGLPQAFHHPRLAFAYRPTVMEWQVAALLLAIGLAVYFIGQMVNKTVAARLATANQGASR